MTWLRWGLEDASWIDFQAQAISVQICHLRLIISMIWGWLSAWAWSYERLANAGILCSFRCIRSEWHLKSSSLRAASPLSKRETYILSYSLIHTISLSAIGRLLWYAFGSANCTLFGQCYNSCSRLHLLQAADVELFACCALQSFEVLLSILQVGLVVLYPLAFPYLFVSLLKQRKKRLTQKQQWANAEDYTVNSGPRRDHINHLDTDICRRETCSWEQLPYESVNCFLKSCIWFKMNRQADEGLPSSLNLIGRL